MGLEEQLPGGILLSTVEKVAGYVRKNSLWPATFGLACCAIEMMATAGPRFDIARFGMERFSATPRQADLMIVAGRVSQKMAPVLRQIYDQMAEPKWVLAMGVCASSGGMFNNYAIVQGVDHVVPVDIYLPGCPPRPEMLLHAILKLHEKIQEMPLGVNREERHRRSRAGGAGGQAHDRDARTAAMSSPDQDPKQAAAEVGGTPAAGGEVINVRHGMFGVAGTGDTSGYGRLVREVTLPGSSPRPYGGYFDDVADRLAEALQRGGVEFDDAIEKVVVDRNELTLHVRRELLPQVAQRLRDEPELRFEMCLGVNGVHYPHETGRELHAVYPLQSITHNRRLRLEVSAPDSDPHIPSLFGSTRPTTGTSARPTTSSASSSTGIRR